MHAELKVPWLNEMKDVCEKIFERSLLPCLQCLLHAITVCTDLLVHHLTSGIWGTKLTCVLATMANRSKEDSELDPIEDELEFIRAMKQAGFDVHVPWQMGLLVPGGELLNNFSKRFGFLCRQIELLRLNGYFDINLINDKTWTSRRVGHEPCVRWGLPINPNGTFTCMAGLCSGVQRRKVTTCFWPRLKRYEPEECQKPCSPMKLSPSLNQLKKLNGLIKWGWTRQRVQHNVALKYTLYKFLLTSSKALPQHAKPLVGAGDEVVICDMRVHSGDHGLGACTLMSDLAANNVVLRHVMVKLKDKKSISAALWSQKRISSHLCNKWLKHEVKLFSQNGAVVPALETEVTATWLRFLLPAGNWQMVLIRFCGTTGTWQLATLVTTGTWQLATLVTTGTWQLAHDNSTTSKDSKCHLLPETKSRCWMKMTRTICAPSLEQWRPGKGQEHGRPSCVFVAFPAPKWRSFQLLLQNMPMPRHLSKSCCSKLKRSTMKSMQTYWKVSWLKSVATHHSHHRMTHGHRTLKEMILALVEMQQQLLN